MPCHIFISYSRSDIVYAEDLSYILERMGFPVWMDRQLEYGQQPPEAWFRLVRYAVAAAHADRSTALLLEVLSERR
jgi:TIR domain